AEDIGRARELSIRSAEASRAADPATTARALATTSRCLAMLEREMPRALAMALEADTLARRHALEIPEVPWALGMMHHFAGELEQARAAHARAVTMNRDAQDHWAECMCLFDLAAIALEERRFDEARAHCQAVQPVA